jgi:periplasmic divalent cation tolerance protein
MSKHSMLYITTGSREEALKIARALVDEKLAACVNVLGEATSIYRWQGKVEEAGETILIAKTRKDLVEKALAWVQALHSYDVPCAVAYDMATGLPPYLAWIDAETT